MRKKGRERERERERDEKDETSQRVHLVIHNKVVRT